MLARYHIAAGDRGPTVYASVEYPVREPPLTITVNGVTYRRVQPGRPEPRSVGDKRARHLADPL